METLSEKIYQELYQDIITQRLACGRRLTLKELKDRFQVSHTPIREALTRLSEIGLVSYYSNRGVTVIDFTEQDITEIYMMASELDAIAVKFSNRAASNSILCHELQECLQRGDALLAEGNPEAWDEASDAFHALFYRYADNRYLDESSRTVRVKIDLLSNICYQNPQEARRVQESHREICASVLKGSFSTAEHQMRQHVQQDLAVILAAWRKRDPAG